MIRIGVLSDTHLMAPACTLPARMLAEFTGVECILHAGDLVDQCVLDRLETIAPVHAVFGNCDPPQISWKLADRVILDVQGCRIGMTHGHLGRGDSTPSRAESYVRDLSPVHVIVFGHSHVPLNAPGQHALLFNPGSPTQRRRQPFASYGILEIQDDTVLGRIAYLREGRDARP